MKTIQDIKAAGGYKAIYSDPPWNYNDQGIRGGIKGEYNGMALEQIMALPVKDIAAPDSALFLWTTWPFLFESKAVIDAWGFKYKTCAFLWVKTTRFGKDFVGTGHYTRANTEPCLLAVRGKVSRLDKAVRQLIWAAERGQEPPELAAPEASSELLVAPRLKSKKHSAKPPEARERIVRLVGDVPRLEMFARDATAGWDIWGHEAPGGISLDAA